MAILSKNDLNKVLSIPAGYTVNDVAYILKSLVYKTIDELLLIDTDDRMPFIISYIAKLLTNAHANNNTYMLEIILRVVGEDIDDHSVRKDISDLFPPLPNMNERTIELPNNNNL